MHCMKCGRDIEDGQVFCNKCLAVMAKYPVKPGIAVQLPNRKEAPPQKKAYVKRRQVLTPEAHIQRLKNRCRRLTILWIITFLLLAATIYPTVEYFIGKSFPLPGQNYTTVTSTQETQP